MRVILGLIAWVFAFPAWADGERAGDFDYYVLSLSWSSSWCLETGDARDDPQCDAGRGLTFVLHGLWPQYEEGGWPSWCRTDQRDATRQETEAMTDIMPSASLAWHEWKAHGRCSGLSARGYFAAARQAWRGLKIPSVFGRVTVPLQVPPAVLEEAFYEANPALPEGAIALSCGDGRIEEVRLCLTPDLAPRPNAPDVGACRMKTVTLPPLR